MLELRALFSYVAAGHFPPGLKHFRKMLSGLSRERSGDPGSASGPCDTLLRGLRDSDGG